MPILPDETIKLKHEEFDFSSLSALIKNIREERRKFVEIFSRMVKIAERFKEGIEKVH